MLRENVSRVENKMDSMDLTGTKGVVALQVQVLDLTKDVTRLGVEMDKRFDSHDRVHKQETHDRISGRRWLIGMGIAGMGSLAAILTVVVEILLHTHS